jgi:hypothetical protein
MAVPEAGLGTSVALVRQARGGVWHIAVFGLLGLIAILAVRPGRDAILRATAQDRELEATARDIDAVSQAHSMAGLSARSLAVFATPIEIGDPRLRREVNS